MGTEAARRVLIVDDVPDMAAHLQKVVEMAGYAVVATSGEATTGIEAARRTRPDVVLMDLMMPGLLGGSSRYRGLTREPKQ